MMISEVKVLFAGNCRLDPRRLFGGFSVWILLSAEDANSDRMKR
jgi:hypothetical protein